MIIKFKKRLSMKKLLVLFFLYLIVALPSYSQSFFQSAGISPSVMYATLARASTRSQDRFSTTNIHFTYFPRINLPIGDYTSLSFGAPLGIGAAFIDNQFMAVKGTFLTYDIPVVLDYNFGFKSNPNSGDDTFGYYFGVGFSSTKVVMDSISDTRFKNSSSGMLLRSGLRLSIPNSNSQKGISLGLFYKFGMGEEKFKTLGANILIDL